MKLYKYSLPELDTYYKRMLTGHEFQLGGRPIAVRLAIGASRYAFVWIEIPETADIDDSPALHFGNQGIEILCMGTGHSFQPYADGQTLWKYLDTIEDDSYVWHFYWRWVP